MLKKADYTYSEKAHATLDGTKAAFFGDTTIKASSGQNETKLPAKAAVFKIDTIPAYTVTVSGSTAETTGAGKYGKGETVATNAGTKPDYSFAGWTSAEGVAFADASSAETTFTMPGNYVICTDDSVLDGSFSFAVSAESEDTNILSYADALNIPDYAFTAMQWACGTGVMKGDGVNLMPAMVCTHAQIVTFIYHCMK